MYGFNVKQQWLQTFLENKLFIENLNQPICSSFDFYSKYLETQIDSMSAKMQNWKFPQTFSHQFQLFLSHYKEVKTYYDYLFI